MQKIVDNELQFRPGILVPDDELQTETVYQRACKTIMQPSDVDIQDQMNIVEASGTLDFWDDPAEDVYDESDGDAV
jgi:hypothetical protein